MQHIDNDGIASDGAINKAWILLDSCSTLNWFYNPSLILNVRPCTEEELMTVYTDSGQVDYNHVGTLSLLPFDIYFDKHSMANILSLKNVSSKFQVTMDTTDENSMNVPPYSQVQAVQRRITLP